METIRQILKPRGNLSSKRLIGIICVVTAIVLAFLNKEVAEAFLYAGSGLLGSTVIEKLRSNDKLEE